MNASHRETRGGRASLNERLLQRLLRASVRRPGYVMVFWLALFALATPGALRVEISTTTDSVLDRSDEEWRFYRDSVLRFGGDEILVLAIQGGEPYGVELLERVVRLTRTLEALPGVRRVDSLATVPLVRADPDGFIDLSPALEAGVPSTPEARRALQVRIEADRVARSVLISEDGRVAALNVLLDGDVEGRFDEIVAGVREAGGEEGAWLSGVPVFRAEINRRAGLEIAKFVVITVLLVTVILAALFRSLAGVLAGLLGGAVGTWAVLAGLGWGGTAITLTTVILPSVMLALGCAYAMHLVAAGRGASGADEVARALGPAMFPTALSGLTTTIGFLGIAAVDIDAIRQVGAYGALGVLVVVAAVLSLVPAFLVRWPVPPTRIAFEADLVDAAARRLTRIGMRHRAWPLGAALALALVLGVGLGRVEIETDVTRWFPHGSDVRDSYERIREHLAGISPVNVVLESSVGPLTSFEALDAIDQLGTHLASQPEVGKVVSVADPLRQLHGGFIGDDRLPLPDDQALVEQYLLLLQSVEYMDDVISRDHREANIVLRADDNGSGALVALARDAEAWWRANGPEGVSARATGIMYEFARAEDEIALGQLRGLLLAFGAIVLILFAHYREPVLTAVAMVPNVLPLAVVFGFLGLTGIPLDAGMVIAGCIVLGIAVDDTLHMIAAIRSRSLAGDPMEKALHGGLCQVLVPIGYSTVVIGTGFAALALSEFTFVANLGVLVSVVMVVCLLADAGLLPSLLAWRGLRGAAAATPADFKRAAGAADDARRGVVDDGEQ